MSSTCKSPKRPEVLGLLSLASVSAMASGVESGTVGAKWMARIGPATNVQVTRIALLMRSPYGSLVGAYSEIAGPSSVVCA